MDMFAEGLISGGWEDDDEHHDEQHHDEHHDEHMENPLLWCDKGEIRATDKDFEMLTDEAFIIVMYCKDVEHLECMI
jgi:hypothetical protein